MPRNLSWREESILNKWFWGNWMPTCRILKLDLYLSLYTKTNFKWIKDANLKPEILKLLQENTGSTSIILCRKGLF